MMKIPERNPKNFTTEKTFVIFSKSQNEWTRKQAFKSLLIICFRGRIFEQTNIQKSQMVYPNQKYFSNDSIGPIQ